LVENDNPGKAAPSNGVISFVPEQEVRVLTPVTHKQWVEAGHIRDLASGQLSVRSFEGVCVLLCRVEDEVFAIRNNCLGTALPLTEGTLEAHYLICPWHGCRYDLTTGDLLDKPGEKLTTFPVKVEESGIIKIGLHTMHTTQ
jgi:nitrite reductase/ring-hydroxylating ferredoxin subunit